MLRVLAFFFILLCVTSARADAIGRLKSFISSTHSGQANFTQELLDKGGKRLQFVSGTMQFLRPGKFRWAYQKPYEQLIVGDGTKFWLYDVELNQVTVKKLDAALGGSPAALLSGSNEIERDFKLRDEGCDAAYVQTPVPVSVPEPVSASAPTAASAPVAIRKPAVTCSGLEWLEAIPRIPDTSFEKIRMAFNAQSDLVVMELRDSFGHLTVLHFSNLRRNPQLAPSLFKFTPPTGADVLGDD